MGEDHHSKTSRVTSDLVDSHNSFDMAETQAAVLLRNEAAEDTQLTQLRHQFDRNDVFLVPLGSVGGNVLNCPVSESLLQHLLFFCEMYIHVGLPPVKHTH